MAYSELHALRSSSSELSADNHLTSFRTALHDESQHTIACSPYSQSIQQFVAEGFALCDGRETTVLNLGSVEGDGVFWEFEAFLDQRGQFADAAALFAQDFLGMCCADDYSLTSVKARVSYWDKPAERTDIGNGRSDADFDARVSLFGQLALEEFVQLSVEDTVCDELSPLRYGGSLGCSGHVERIVYEVGLRKRSSTIEESRWWE